MNRNKRLEDEMFKLNLPERGLLWSCEKRGLFTNPDDYGWMRLGHEELSEVINASDAQVRHALWMMRQARVLRKLDDTTYMIPLMQDERRHHDLREELRELMARFRADSSRLIREANGRV